jgi:hypothetical protein
MTSLLPSKRYSSLLLASLLILFGCSSTPNANLSKFNPGQEAIYPKISVMLISKCRNCYSYRDIFISALQETNVFESIEISEANTDFQMEVYIDLENVSMQDDAEGTAKAIIAGATMMLLPIPMEFIAKGTIKLSYQGNIFEEFKIECYYKTILSLYSAKDKDAGAPGAYRKIVETIIEEIMERKSFDKIIQKNR